MTIWIVFEDPYNSGIEDIFDSEEKAEAFRVERLWEWKWPKPVHGKPYFWKQSFTVQ